MVATAQQAGGLRAKGYKATLVRDSKSRTERLRVTYTVRSRGTDGVLCIARSRITILAPKRAGTRRTRDDAAVG